MSPGKLQRALRHPLAAAWRRARRRGHVVMFHVGRSGSTVLADLLSQHPRMHWDGEVYQHVFRERQHRDGSLPPIRDVDPVRYAVDRARTRGGGRYYGFEAKFFHLRALGADLAPYLQALDQQLKGLHWVVLERGNLLRMVVSTLAARATGRWHLPAGSAASPRPVHVGVNGVFVNRESSPLLELLEQLRRDFAELDRLLAIRPTLKLSYEADVQQDPRRAYRMICDFLGLPHHTVEVRRAPTNPFPLPELIENYDEVVATLRGTEFEPMLEVPYALKNGLVS